MPISYSGRSSSVVVSGTPVKRPVGQFFDKHASVQEGERPPVICAASRELDFEVEFAAVIGKPLPLGQGVDAKDADQHIFGYVVLNDWSCK